MNIILYSENDLFKQLGKKSSNLKFSYVDFSL